MGSQGHVSNIMGIITSAKLTDKENVYTVNGKTVGMDGQRGAEFEGGVMSVDMNSPNLSIRILGHTTSMGSRHFEKKALVGYAFASEYYWANATELPSQEIIDGLKPLLVNELKEKLSLEVTVEQLKNYLLYNYDNNDE